MAANESHANSSPPPEAHAVLAVGLVLIGFTLYCEWDAVAAHGGLAIIGLVITAIFYALLFFAAWGGFRKGMNALRYFVGSRLLMLLFQRHNYTDRAEATLGAFLILGAAVVLTLTFLPRMRAYAVREDDDQPGQHLRPNPPSPTIAPVTVLPDDPSAQWNCPQCASTNPNNTFQCVKCKYSLV